MFTITKEEISTEALSQQILSKSIGAVVSFEGRVRDHNFGRRVLSLEYEMYPELVLSEGSLILQEALGQFEIENCAAVHRYGQLELGAVAVSVVAVSAHREAAFRACRYIIDELKLRLPIWKKEYYSDTEAAWVECKGCKHVSEERKNAGPILEAAAFT